MFVQWFTLLVSCLIVTGTEEPACKRWKYHENFDLVHSGGDCGKVKIKEVDTFSPRILNGEPAQPGSLPWIAYVLIGDEEKFECGGSVINENYILTAAHCMDSENNTITVTLGVHNVQNLLDGPAEIYNVSKCIIHPEYDRLYNLNDIALLRLDRSISFESPYINYICLPTSCELSEQTLLGERLTMAGWGDTEVGKTANILQKVKVSVKECNTYYRYGELVSPEGQLCAGSNLYMACVGDSGGPLVYKTAERFVQVGVLSFGPAVCSSSANDKFDHYSRVSSFMGWILDNIGT